ncbi:hypothetical protein ACIA5E_18940 [Nocardia asteroides]|uniref:hypothetical protein n=1 Tax=Nocardia asteroides TaxID=1824 RepID=UPI003789D2B6
MSSIFTTGKGVQLAVGYLYTDIYRDGARVLLVTDIAEPTTDLKGRAHAQVSYRVVVREGARITSARVQRIDADRLADPKLYARVTDPKLLAWVRGTAGAETPAAVEVPADVTEAQVKVARGYVRACVEYVTAEPEHIAAVEAMSADAVVRKALRMWDGDWAHFCEYFASDIRNAEQEARS